MSVVVRRVQLTDIAAFVELCCEHALYECTEVTPPDAARLRVALFARSPKLHAWVAVDDDAQLLGYATATIDYSTWNAREFMHLDCLYLKESARARGLGELLFDAVRVTARTLGIEQLQWQTPAWNVAAQRFYSRRGAVSQTKVRFTLRP